MLLHADAVDSCADSWHEQACHGLAERLAVGAGVAIGGQRDAEPIKVEASVEVDELIEALDIVREVTRGSGG